MATLAIDYGDVRVGLAICEQGSMPRQLGIIQNNDELLSVIANVAHEQRVDTIVVGLPRNLDGDDTPQTLKAREFATSLNGKLARIDIKLQDEAGTSSVARERLLSGGVSEQELKKYLDAEAAVIILEDYLDGL